MKERRPEDYICPVCGYYCLGKGGVGCIDKPSLVNKHPLEEICKNGPAYREFADSVKNHNP